MLQFKNTNDIIRLNVSGTSFTLSRQLLTSVQGSYLEEMFAKENDANLKKIIETNEVFVNSDP